MYPFNTTVTDRISRDDDINFKLLLLYKEFEGAWRPQTRCYHAPCVPPSRAEPLIQPPREEARIFY